MANLTVKDVRAKIETHEVITILIAFSMALLGLILCEWLPDLGELISFLTLSSMWLMIQIREKRRCGDV